MIEKKEEKSGGGTIETKLAEQSLVGSVLLKPEIFPEVLESVAGDDFYLVACRNVFEACRKLFMLGRPIDLVSVLHAMDGAEEDHKLFLTELVQAVPTAAHYAEYARAVRENACRRRALAACVELHEALTGGAPLDDCVEITSQIAQHLTVESGECVSAEQGFMMVYSGLGKPCRYIRTGFATLDRYALIDKGDYIVIGARPSAGKTALSLQIAQHMARERRVVYFSLETSAKKIYERLLSCYSGVSFGRINHANPTEAEIGMLNRDFREFTGLKLTVVDAAGWNAAQIRATAVRLQAEVVIIDYLGLIRGTGKSLYERVTNVSMDLHTMAQHSRIAVVALSQLNRAGDGDPDMTNLRESGQIEQDADVVLMLSASKDVPESRKLIISKNKIGRCGKITMEFDGDHQRFTEVVKDDAQCPPF